jgi:hypothetical protein
MNALIKSALWVMETTFLIKKLNKSLYRHVSGVCVTSTNEFWIGWLHLLTPSCKISLTIKKLTINLDCRGPAPFSFSFFLNSDLSQRQSHMRLTVSQSVSLSWCQAPSGAHDQILVTVWQLLSCPWEGALSDDRTGVVCQSVSSIRPIVSMYNFYILHVSHVIEYIYNIYKASVSPGSHQYSRLCPISGSFPLTAV